LGFNPRKLKRELLGNVVVFLNDRLVLRVLPRCLKIRINEPVSYMASYDSYTVASVGKSAEIDVDHNPSLIKYRVDVEPRPIGIQLRPVEFNDIERGTVEIRVTMSEPSGNCFYEPGEWGVKLPLGNDKVEIRIFGKKECILISREKYWKNGRYFFDIMPFDILRSCDKKMLMQILKVPKNFRDPELPIQKFTSNS